jgi:hypothetical protein
MFTFEELIQKMYVHFREEMSSDYTIVTDKNIYIIKKLPNLQS